MALLPGLIRIAIIGLALVLLVFTGHATATGDKTPSSFEFPACVNNCVTNTKCGGNPKCMCRATKHQFLGAVLNCMSRNCVPELRDAGDSFLDIMVEGCDAIDKPIKDEIVERAEKFATALWQKITKTATPTEDSPKKTSSPPPEKTTAKEKETSSESTTALIFQTTDTPIPNTAAAPPPPPEPTTPAAGAPANQPPVDGSPFDNPSPSRAPQSLMAFVSWCILPLAAILVSFS